MIKESNEICSGGSRFVLKEGAVNRRGDGRISDKGGRGEIDLR